MGLQEAVDREFIILITVGILVFGACLLGFYFRGGRAEDSVASKMQVSEEDEEAVRGAVAAGKFYPAEASELRSMIAGLLEEARREEMEGEVIGLLVPHAGYGYSGRVAAAGFKQIEGEEIDTVVILGRSHKHSFDGVSVFPHGYYETPLGRVKIDEVLAEALLEDSANISYRREVHRLEHSIEVEVPFLQVVLEDFQIIPLLFGNLESADYQSIAEVLVRHLEGRNAVLVASSDLSHYPTSDQARYADNVLLESFLDLDAAKTAGAFDQLKQEDIPSMTTPACAEEAIKTMLAVVGGLGADQALILNYSNSGEVTGNLQRVVGYGAVGVYAERRGIFLNDQERATLLGIARQSVESQLLRGEVPDFSVTLEFLKRKQGAFVTLKRDGKLRGCLGEFSSTGKPLYRVVSQMAVAAVTRDQRFSPVVPEELAELEYEISVLSDLRKITSWQEVEVGRHGVKVKKGSRSGVFLPQVAVENGWNRKAFLSALCLQKAGLAKDCYTSDGVELYVFTAQVFGD